MRLLKLIEEIEGIRFGNSLALEDIEIVGICPDSSRVTSGELYIAIEGLRSDGHEYVYEAIDRGAAAVAVSESALREKRIDAEGNGNNQSARSSKNKRYRKSVTNEIYA